MDDTASQTVDELETRLRRIRYIVAGHSSSTDDDVQAAQSDGRTQTVSARLVALEHALTRLSKRSPVVRDILDLCNHLFRDHPWRRTSWLIFDPDERQPDVLKQGVTEDTQSLPDKDAMLAMVMAQASLYSKASTDLAAIHDIPIPAPETSIEMLALQPRAARLDPILEKQAREIAGLRERSATALSRWYKINVLAGGECWAEWEQRLATAERAVTRIEKAREQEEDV